MTAQIVCCAGSEPLPDPVLDRLAEQIKSGKTFIFPTDTLYGIGANGLLPESFDRIYRVKGRDSRKPLPILIHSLEEIKRWVRLSPAAETLAEMFWPGPLTMVLTPTSDGKRLLSPGSDQVAVRIPAHPITLALLSASGVPWVTSSANVSGSAPAADGRAAAELFAGEVDFIVDAGPCAGVASTVVDASGSEIRILREGVLSRRKIEELK